MDVCAAGDLTDVPPLLQVSPHRLLDERSELTLRLQWAQIAVDQQLGEFRFGDDGHAPGQVAQVVHAAQTVRTGGIQQPAGGTEGAVRRGEVRRRAEPRRHLQVARLRLRLDDSGDGVVQHGEQRASAGPAGVGLQGAYEHVRTEAAVRYGSDGPVRRGDRHDRRAP
ncbi:hypothetical protein [Streptomyces sp. SLBN-31]|uniref:hypothetical protein n=1 Tax=Streptomyces sp. SLBN-31 TaxID=2768444 RepID=UPI0015753534|nr:hypothetical protein [Streptomyces sp. SLBN-31]